MPTEPQKDLVAEARARPGRRGTEIKGDEMRTNTKISNCDGCDEPQGEIKPRFAYGCEGDFCHTCRHGKECDCGD